jgi:hypothetical protein
VVAFQIAAGDVIKEKVRAAVGVKVLEEPLFNVDLVAGWLQDVNGTVEGIEEEQ